EDSFFISSTEDCLQSFRGNDARYLHGFSAARQLPQQLVTATERVGGAGSGFGIECVREFDAIDHAVFEPRTFPNVKLVSVAVARAQSLITLTRLMERVEIHNQVKLVVRRIRHPCERVGVISTRFIQNRKRLTMAGRGNRLREA